jgi:hypothetical protein
VKVLEGVQYGDVYLPRNQTSDDRGRVKSEDPTKLCTLLHVRLLVNLVKKLNSNHVNSI